MIILCYETNILWLTDVTADFIHVALHHLWSYREAIYLWAWLIQLVLPKGCHSCNNSQLFSVLSTAYVRPLASRDANGIFRLLLLPETTHTTKYLQVSSTHLTPKNYQHAQCSSAVHSQMDAYIYIFLFVRTAIFVM